MLSFAGRHLRLYQKVWEVELEKEISNSTSHKNKNKREREEQKYNPILKTFLKLVKNFHYYTSY